MINSIIFNGHSFAYECERLIRSYFPPVKLDLLHNAELPTDKYILTEKSGNKLTVKICDSKVIEYSETFPDNADEKEQERIMCVLICKTLEEYTGQKLGWGILTGIRPVKLMEKYLSEGNEQYLKEKLLITDEKIALAKAIIKAQTPIVNSLKRKYFSLYVSIPFCPARCSYCSFVSHSVKQAGKLIPAYVDKLCEEIRIFAKIAEELDFTLDTIYIGGGTPTILTPEQLCKIFAAVESFDMSKVREYTVEAGRPDTIDKDKLLAIKSAGVTRISINPQTMNNDVLKAVGRNHTAEDIIRTFNLAKSLGFDNINTDLIAGLPNDTVESFCDSLDKVIALDPADITVHNLALKRSSELYWDENKPLPDHVGKMIRYSQEKLFSSGYEPYYLYRQKNTLENHENIGWAKNGMESIYNVYIMEEIQPIFAAGCSGSTKLVDFDTGKIERVFNYKFPYEYIDRFDLMMEKKKQIFTFYGIEK